MCHIIANRHRNAAAALPNFATNAYDIISTLFDYHYSIIMLTLFVIFTYHLGLIYYHIC
jgi:hypothetical protein